MSYTEKYIGNSAMSESPEKKLKLVIKDGSVTTPKIADGAVTPAKLSEGALETAIEPYINNLQTQIDSLSHESGAALKQGFGSETTYGISQNALTQAFIKVWNKLEEITGETLYGISMSVSPASYFIGESGCEINVTATPTEVSDIFDSIYIYFNGELKAEGENVSELTYSDTIYEDTTIRCVATILGVQYEREAEVKHFSSYWIGFAAEDDYASVMSDNDNLVEDFTENMRGSYDRACADGNHLFIVMNDTFSANFVRADMNGFEIPFETKETVTINNVTYAVYQSSNAYQEGTYNIDINS